MFIKCIFCFAPSKAFNSFHWICVVVGVCFMQQKLHYHQKLGFFSFTDNSKWKYKLLRIFSSPCFGSSLYLGLPWCVWSSLDLKKKKKGGRYQKCPIIASQKESFVSINPRTVKQNWIYFSLLEKDVVLQQYHKRVVKESLKHVSVVLVEGTALLFWPRWM